MAQTSVSQFATELKVPPSVLLEQLRAVDANAAKVAGAGLLDGRIAIASVGARLAAAA